MSKVGELKAREMEVAREWEWLQDFLYKAARSRCDQQDARLFERLQHQALIVGERRTALRSQIAMLEGPAQLSSSS